MVVNDNNYEKTIYYSFKKYVKKKADSTNESALIIKFYFTTIRALLYLQ